MWVFDIYYNIYSQELNRQIRIRKHDIFDPKGRHCYFTVYALFEEWHTPESQGNTIDFDFYQFKTYRDAASFMVKLLIKFNNPCQNALLEAANEFATAITQNHKKFLRVAPKRSVISTRPKPTDLSTYKESIPKSLSQKKIHTITQPTDPKKRSHVYIFEYDHVNDAGIHLIKIGYSINVTRRIPEVSGGLDVIRACHTKEITAREAREFEYKCHKYFEPNRKPTKLEYFFTSYEEAQNYLETITGSKLIKVI